LAAFRVLEIALRPYPARVAASTFDVPTPKAMRPHVPAVVALVVR